MLNNSFILHSGCDKFLLVTFVFMSDFSCCSFGRCFSLFILVSILSCGQAYEDDEIKYCPEVITSLRYTLTSDSNGDVVILEATDLESLDFGNPATIVGGVLDANASYVGDIEILLLDGSIIEDLTQELFAESEDNQLFFSSTIPDLQVNYADEDSNGNPLGLMTTMRTGNRGIGELIIVLRHEPDKFAEGVSDGIIENAGGETDVEITFPMRIE